MQLHAVSVVDVQVLLLRSGEQTFVVQEAGVAHRLVHVKLVDDAQGPRTRKEQTEGTGKVEGERKVRSSRCAAALHSARSKASISFRRIAST